MSCGLVFNIQRFCINDGPGIRTTIFLKGCPLNCAWCHNPEGIATNPEVITVENRCILCGRCMEICPDKPVEKCGARKSLKILEKCLKVCGQCAQICPAQARQIVGKYYNETELTNEILKDRVFFEEEGGVTFSGGEPLRQTEFLIAVIEKLKKYEIHIAIDTCGFADPDALRTIAKLADLFLYDLKFISGEKHKIYTGVTNELIIENLILLNNIHRNIWLRIPLIGGVNTDDYEIGAITRFIKPLKSIRQINLLPYHKTGIQKAKRIKDNLRIKEFISPSNQELNRIKSILSGSGLTVKIGG